MKIEESFVIAGNYGSSAIPSIWDFYAAYEIAEDHLKANAEKFANEYPEGASVMPYAAFEEARRKTILAKPVKAITSERFFEMLEVLPPLAWENDGVLETFLMSEFTTGSFTEQYARFRDRYFSKTVDARNRETWISLPMIATHDETVAVPN